MSELKQQLQRDLTAAMKQRDTRTVSTLRMALAAVGTEEVAGTAARELSDEEILEVLAKEAKKRRESAQAYTDAGRQELATSENAEREILETYLPAQLDDDELSALVRQAVTEVTTELGDAPGQKQMGQVMQRAQAKVAKRAEGSRVAAAVKAALAG